MKINLNNYETFFLMYIDNELSAPEKLSVESFLQEYPYLREEMDLLKGMVLPGGEKFELDKTSLYRSGVMNENMQEAMLLHLDNELPAPAKTALLKKLEEDKTLQHSWELLQKTKLDAAEMVSFPHKKILYRTETGRLITGKFARWAIAAALTGAGFFIGVYLLRQQAATQTELSSKAAQKTTGNGTATATGTKKEIVTKEGNVQPVADSNQSQQNDPVQANNAKTKGGWTGTS
jgi:anti-sigma factor RsiW